MAVRMLKGIGLVLLAGVLGAAVVFVLFAMGMSGAKEGDILVIAVLAFLAAGLIIGVISPKWWPLAVLTGWPGPMVFTEAITMSVRYESAEIELEDWLFLLVPLGAAVLGGYVGKLLRTLRRQPQDY
jgi:hypothetical protein